MKLILPLLMVLSITFLSSCNQGNVSTPAAAMSPDGYTVEDKNGYSSYSKYNEDGNLEEEGSVINGLKTGSWVKYDKDSKVREVSSYMNGKLNGPVFSFSNRGQMEKLQYFTDDVLDGKYVEYKFGRPLKEGMYNNGQLHGLYTEYYNNGKKQRSITYKNGVLDGPMIYFNEEGGIMMNYIYKDGEKVEQ